MNLSFLSETSESLMEYMRLQKYSEPYVVRHIRMLNHISKHAVECGWETFSDVLQWYMHQSYSQLYLADIKKVLFNLEYFHINGAFPGNGAIQRELREKNNSIGQLNLSFLQEHLKELLGYMQEHNYSKHYCKTVSYIARRIIVLSRTLSWDSYLEVWKWYQIQNLKSTYLNNVRTVLGLLEKFHLSGEMPNNRESQSTLCTRDSAYSKLVLPYRSLVDFSISLAEQRDLSKGSIKSMKSVASSFLLAMQKAGADVLEKISGDLVNVYFRSASIRVNGRGVSPRLIRFFKDCIKVNEECNRMVYIIPRIPSGRKNIQYITKEESKAFCDALLDFKNGLTYKTRAIGIILFYTGIRKTDIMSLKLNSVDLRQKTISLIQRKTQNPLVLPLSPAVGNAIYDYCMMERPNTASLNLFVGNNAPHHKVGTGTVNNAIDSIMEVAGIRQRKGDRKGSHIFRHRMATTLLENNISPAVISAVLGHASPNSLDTYLYADKVHLKECALSLSAYPISEEVFVHASV